MERNGLDVSDWLPTGSLNNLRQRAVDLAKIRQFFAERGVLEVETPSLSQAASSELQLDSFVVDTGIAGEQRYLHTSPEYPMKRLLAAGSGDIYQLAKVYRRGELGRWHNPEFTLLEWYRIDYRWRDLADECVALLNLVLNTPAAEYSSYDSLWREAAGKSFDEICATDVLALLQAANIPLPASCKDKSALADLYFSLHIQPDLGREKPLVVYDYPAEQASLAQVAHNESAKPIALRFELFWQGVELGNGFEELRDAEQLAERFADWNEQRKQAGKNIMPIDERLLAAMQQGLPACSGVAIGIDRLLALAYGADSLAEVISFDASRA